MKRLSIIIVFILLLNIPAKSQSIGFSYFFPKDGYFGSPIAPISMSLPVSFGDLFYVDIGFSLYNIGGMSVKGFGNNFENNKPMIGPFQSLNIHLAPNLRFNSKSFILDFSAGGFIFMNFNERLLHHNFDEMIKDNYQYDMINSNVNIDPKFIGTGLVFGSKITLKVSKKYWLFFGGNYYVGRKDIPINYTYNALFQSNVVIESGQFDKTYLQYEGFEFSIGVSIKK